MPSDDSALTLVINLGLRSNRAIVFGGRGNILASASRLVKTMIDGDRVEQDPNEWWQQTIEIIREINEDADIRRSIRYLTITSSSSCLIPLDNSGIPLAYCLMVSDKRAQAQVEELAALPSFLALQAHCSQFQMMPQPSMALPKMLWIKQVMPEVFEDCALFVGPSDFLAYQLTGKMVTDPLNAEKAHYDCYRGVYPEAVFEDLGLRVEHFPKVAPIGSVVGPVSRVARGHLGFEREQRVDVVLSTYDAICALYGAEPAVDDELCLVSGTVSSARMFVSAVPKVTGSQVFAQYISAQNRHIVGGSNNLGGGLIEWARQTFYSDVSDAYALMVQDALAARPGAGGLVFLPYLLGERMPIWNAHARGVFFGIDRTHSRREMMRAVFESVGFVTRELIDAIESSLVSARPSVIRFSGGLARMDIAAQHIADISGKRVDVLDNFETTALGAWILTGVGRSDSSFVGMGAMVGVERSFIPNAATRAMYDEWYGFFRMLYRTNIELFEQRERMVDRHHGTFGHLTQL